MTSKETDIHTTIFWDEDLGVPEIEFDRISHFYSDEQRWWGMDYWGKKCLVIGYRERVIAPYQPRLKPGMEPLGHGGEFWVYYPHDKSIGGIHPSKINPI